MVDDLLEIAHDLVERERGKPRQASLRRAVSTAYYAVFHTLADLCADELVGWNKPWSVFSPVYRSLDHNEARRLFERARTTKSYGPNVEKIGIVFLRLRQAREEADYDPEPFRYGRDDSRKLIEEAQKTVAAIRSLDAETTLLLAAHLVTKRRRTTTADAGRNNAS
jgi:hypothetical protein